MIDLRLSPPEGARVKKHIVGRGKGCGWRKTAKRGARGQTARTSGNVKIGFEGGQMPLYRRLPIRGFSNKRFQKKIKILNVSQLDSSYQEGDTVNWMNLYQKGLIRKSDRYVKILAKGPLTKKLNFESLMVSAPLQ